MDRIWDSETSAGLAGLLERVAPGGAAFFERFSVAGKTRRILVALAEALLESPEEFTLEDVRFLHGLGVRDVYRGPLFRKPYVVFNALDAEPDPASWIGAEGILNHHGVGPYFGNPWFASGNESSVAYLMRTQRLGREVAEFVVHVWGTCKDLAFKEPWPVSHTAPGILGPLRDD